MSVIEKRYLKYINVMSYSVSFHIKKKLLHFKISYYKIKERDWPGNQTYQKGEHMELSLLLMQQINKIIHYDGGFYYGI